VKNGSQAAKPFFKGLELKGIRKGSAAGFSKKEADSPGETRPHAEQAA
jgi:hypothetical protein